MVDPDMSMLSVFRRHTLVQVSRFYREIDHAARAFQINRWLLVGLIAQESAGNTYAVRVEPGFWRRYHKEMIRQALRTPDKNDDKWMKYPQLAACSYGLMQVMYQTALECGMKLRYPTELCNPVTGLEAGCKYLKRCLQRADDNEAKALLYYNGGGDPTYPRKVQQWADDARGSGTFYRRTPRE